MYGFIQNSTCFYFQCLHMVKRDVANHSLCKESLTLQNSEASSHEPLNIFSNKSMWMRQKQSTLYKLLILRFTMRRSETFWVGKLPFHSYHPAPATTEHGYTYQELQWLMNLLSCEIQVSMHYTMYSILTKVKTQ